MRLRGLLGVVSGIALGACVVTTNDGERDSPIGPVGSGGTSGGTAGSAGAGGGGTAGSAAGAGAAGRDSGADSSADAAIDSATDAVSDGATTDGNSDSGTTDGATTDGATTDGGTCNDGVGSSVDCSGVNPDPGCGVVGTPFQKSYCERAPTLFKPRVAQRISSCIAGLSPIELCTPLMLQCIDNGLRSACADTSVNVQCTAIVGACPAIALAQCQLYLAGMTATARARMVSCMSAGCNLANCAREL